jgi:hypothetical protein
VYRWQVSLRLTFGPSSTAIAMAKTAASPSSASASGVATSRVTTSRGSSTHLRRREEHPHHTLRVLQVPWEFREDAWHSLHTFVWWFGRTSLGPTYWRSTMGLSAPPSSYRSTPRPSSQREGMRPSWPTTFPWLRLVQHGHGS